MTNREIIQRVLSAYSKGVPSDDVRLRRRHIYSKLITARERLLTQEAKKSQFISAWNYQTLDCITLKEAPLIECPCVPPIGCKILKSVSRIPKIMADADGHLLQGGGVTTLDGDTTIYETTWETKKYGNGNKYTSKAPDMFFRNNYLYITTPKKPEKVTMTALFSDPFEVFTFNGCCDTADNCRNFLDEVFPLEGDLIEVAIQLAAEELITGFQKVQEDITNNTAEGTYNDSK